MWLLKNQIRTFYIRTFYCKTQTSKFSKQNDIVNLAKQTDFDNKLKNVKSNKNKLNELLKNAKYQQKFNKRYDK